MSNHKQSANQPITRRTALGVMAGATGALLANPWHTAAAAETEPFAGSLKQSVCRWCYQKMPLEELADNAKAMGYRSIELLKETEWPIVQKRGMECAVGYGPTTIGRGWNHEDSHPKFIKESKRLLRIIGDAGIPNMICFSGNSGRLTSRTFAETWTSTP